MSSTRTLYVHGMHCASCVILIEDKLSVIEGIEGVKANLGRRTVECACALNVDDEHLSTLLTPHVAGYGYAISTVPEQKGVAWREFYAAIPIALVFVAAFVLLQKAGIVHLIRSDTVTLPVAFLIGIVASLSTCMAVVGGLVLSLSATWGKSGTNTRSQVGFHAGRLIGFFLLGGVIGIIGAAFTLTPAISFAFSLLIGIVMLVLGINLLDVTGKTAAWQLRLPKLFSIPNLTERKSSGPFYQGDIGLALIGAATFFLPCGFTQAMQVYTLSSGGFLNGALTMLVFALGTLPVLALVSFGAGSITTLKHKGMLFKAAGIIVILFALFNIISGMIAMGWIPPIFNFG